MRLGKMLILGAALLTAMPLFGQVQVECDELSVGFPDTPSVRDDPGFRWVVDNLGETTEVRVYTNGVLAQIWQLVRFSNGYGYQIFRGGIQYNPANTPHGYYSGTNVQNFLKSLCPNGVNEDLRGAIDPVTVQRHSDTGIVDSPSGQAAEYVALGDFNGDGIVDSATETTTGISINLYRADGTFSAASYPISGIQFSSIVAADFNGDGNLDLAVPLAPGSSGQGQVAVLLGRGDGTFGAPANAAAGPYPFYLAIGDFNADGKTDLAITNAPSNIGTASTVSVLPGKGDGTFASPVSYAVGNFPGTIVAADFNGDGKLDLAVLDNATGVAYVNKLWVLLGKGDGTFQTAVSTATGTLSGYLSYADLNHDGKVDVLIADQLASAMSVLMGNGDGTFQPPQRYVAGAQPISVAIQPLGDGNTALFIADSLTANLAVGFVASDGSIDNPPLQSIGQNPAAIAAADLNGDGHPDLVITDSEAGNIYVELASGNAQFKSPVTYSLGSQPGAVAIADVNGDGKPDVIAADATGLDVLLGNGNGTFGAVKTFAAGGSLSSIAIADFNSDGKPDVASANATAG